MSDKRKAVSKPSVSAKTEDKRRRTDGAGNSSARSDDQSSSSSQRTTIVAPMTEDDSDDDEEVTLSAPNITFLSELNQQDFELEYIPEENEIGEPMNDTPVEVCVQTATGPVKLKVRRYTHLRPNGGIVPIRVKENVAGPSGIQKVEPQRDVLESLKLKTEYARNVELLQNFNEIFKCTICLASLENPHLCPKCSKLYCFACIMNWLCSSNGQNKNCPNCKGNLREETLVKVRWLDDVESLRRNQNRKNQNEKGDCSLHQKKMELFCSTCKCCICNDCIHKETSHETHAFRTIDSVFEAEAASIASSFKNVEDHLEKIKLLETRISENIKIVNEVKKRKLEELVVDYESAVENLNQQADEKLAKLNGHHSAIKKEREDVEKSLKEFQSQMDRSTKSQLIMKKAELVDFCKIVAAKPILKFDQLRVLPYFKCPLPLRYDTGVFLLKGYSTIPIGAQYYSIILNDNYGHKWRLKVVKREEDVGVYLELKEGYPCSFECILQLMHSDTTKILERRNTHLYDSEDETDWGYTRFTAAANNIKDYLNEDDTLEFRFHIRPCGETNE